MQASCIILTARCIYFLRNVYNTYSKDFYKESVNYVISTPITIIIDIRLYYTYQCSWFSMP